MIIIDTIEEVEDCDGESIFAYGRDEESGDFAWAWVPVETLQEHGRYDLLRYAGIIHDHEE